jgi:pyruvate kinase
MTTTIAIAAVNASMKSMAAGIVVITTTGRTAHVVSQYRPRCPIIAVSRYTQTTRQAHLFRGILPLHYEPNRVEEWTQDVDIRIKYAIEFGKKKNFLKIGDAVIVITGWRKGAGATNTLRVIYVE